MEIDLPNMREQKAVLRRENVRKAVEQLQRGLEAPYMPGPAHFNYRAYSTAHLRTENEGWEAPPHEVVNAWFEHFKGSFPEYSSDRLLGELLGLAAHADRRMRAFRLGERKVPYGIWRRFLVLTGRVSQEIIPVMVIVEDREENSTKDEKLIVRDEFHLFQSNIKRNKSDPSFKTNIPGLVKHKNKGD